MKRRNLFAALLALVMLCCLALPGLAQETIWKKGDTGDDVTRMQARLQELGYLKNDPTGIFDDATEEAVLAFQQRNGLLKTGMADANTWAALFSDSARPAPQPTPTPAAASTGWRSSVNSPG